MSNREVDMEGLGGRKKIIQEDQDSGSDSEEEAEPELTA